MPTPDTNKPLVIGVIHGVLAMLTDTEIRKLKPTEKPQKISDGHGLFLMVTPQGSKLWRMAYCFAGKQKTLAIGEYPTISQADARTKRESAKKLLANGIDPSMAKRAAKAANQEVAANSFEVIAREWHATHMAKKTLNNLERDIFPWLG